jgi:hypothetical protein
MALRDHFHPPLSTRRHWHAFHNAWATYLASNLNQRLPAGYFAESNVQFGIEIDVATFEEGDWGEGEPAAPVVTWTPPAATKTIPFQIAADTVEVTIFNTREGPVLAGAIELISPANKDRATHRHAFVSKCETYLNQGIGLVIVDIVTDRRANLHNELLKRLGSQEMGRFESDLYTTAYRPVEHEGQASLEIWEETLALGRPLPTMPLWLPGFLSIPVELNETYERTCREQRITSVGEYTMNGPS